MRILLAAAVASFALGACGPSDRDTPTDAPSSQDGKDIDAPPGLDTSRVFAHSNNMLYRLNSLTLAAEAIGPMTGIGTQGMLDLAIDKDDNFIGVTRDKLYTINALSGAATAPRDLSQAGDGYTSLSFAPANFNDANSPDILVTANDQGQVFQINMGTGVPTMIGSYGTHPTLGKVVSSGDLIAVRGVGIFATVDVGTETEDYLARIDPATWKATPIGKTGFDKIFGLGFWGGRIYGFIDDGFAAATGRIVDIDMATGKGTLISSDSIRWFGAAVATDAPIL